MFLCIIISMLYRHFPKIANLKFSILSIDLADPSSKNIADEIFTVASSYGVNLYRAGSNVDHCRFLLDCEKKLNSDSSFYRILDFTGKSTTELEIFLKNTKTDKPDILLLPINTEEDIENLLKSKIFTAIEKATEEGRLLGAGFSAPPLPTLLRMSLSSWSGWTFFSTIFNYLHEDIIPVMLEASSEGISLLVTKPFENGELEQAPAKVHEVFRNAKVPRRHDEWALRGIWEQQEVTSVLSDSNSTFLTEIRCILAEAGRPNSLPSFELETLKTAAREFKALKKNP